jgi:Phasin protein
MSSHNPRSPTQSNSDNQQMNWKTTLRIASVMAEANERLFRVQSEAANAAFTENTKHLKALLNTLNTKDSSVLLAEWTNLYQANMRRILEVTRSCFEIVPQTQAQIADLVGEPFASANKQTQQYVDQFTNAIGNGSDAATATAKAFLAKAVANASSKQPAKKAKVA